MQHRVRAERAPRFGARLRRFRTGAVQCFLYAEVCGRKCIWDMQRAHREVVRGPRSDAGHLDELRDESIELEKQKAEFDLKKALGLTTADRWSSPRPLDVGGLRAQGGTGAAFVPLDAALIEQPTVTPISAFAADADKRYTAKPWHLRSSMLHGAIYGVPVAGKPISDRRPADAALSVAIGSHDDDLLAAFASDPAAKIEERRATERLLAAFTSQKVNRLGSADGVVELEEFEHAAAFSSLDLNWRDYVKFDASLLSVVEPVASCGNPAKARRLLGWENTVPFAEIAARMVRSEYDRLG